MKHFGRLSVIKTEITAVYWESDSKAVVCFENGNQLNINDYETVQSLREYLELPKQDEIKAKDESESEEVLIGSHNFSF